MKIKMLITALLIGTSTMASVAVAQPTYSPDDSSYHRRPHEGRWHHRRANRVPMWEQNRDGGWTYSGGYFPVPVPYNDDGNQDYRWRPAYGDITNAPGQREIRFGSEGASFSMLRIEPRGSIYVSQVLVSFAGGHYELMKVGRWISDREGDGLSIDLNGRRQITRVMVYTPGQRDVDYQLLGR